MFTKKEISACLKIGFEKAFIEQGNLVALFPQGDKELIVETDGPRKFKARVLIGGDGMASPRYITKHSGDGFAPVYRFDSVHEAARLAFNNPQY